MVLAVIDFPYAYYQILRFVALFAFGVAAYMSFNANQKIIPYVLGFMALLFNPFIKINLGRELWMIVDIVSGVCLAVWTLTFFRNKGA
ncbi:hypothetical protein AsoHEU7_10195 [Acinetobacter soli]|nr:hypothetical protein AsoHEU7_10195 [Acinetobacter soli]